MGERVRDQVGKWKVHQIWYGGNWLGTKNDLGDIKGTSDMKYLCCLTINEDFIISEAS